MPVAQLDRASVCGTEGRTFESYQAHHTSLFEPLGLFFGEIAEKIGLICSVPNFRALISNSKPLGNIIFSRATLDSNHASRHILAGIVIKLQTYSPKTQ